MRWTTRSAAFLAVFTAVNGAWAGETCIAGTPLCANTQNGAVVVATPSPTVQGSANAGASGRASGSASGTGSTPPVHGAAGGQGAAWPTLDLGFLLSVGAALQAQTQSSVKTEVETAPPAATASTAAPWGYGPQRKSTYEPSVGISFCGGAHVSSSFVGPIACLGVGAFIRPWLSVDNDLFYMWGKSTDDGAAHRNLTRHQAAWQPTLALHAQAAAFRFTGRLGGTLEVGPVSREAQSCEAPGPNTQAICTEQHAVDETRAYAGGVAGIGFGFAEQIALMVDLRAFAKGRVDAGDNDEPLGRAEVGGMFMLRFGLEAGSWKH